jgi:8-oxo-dGTP pyrophosphatase MutT (NUDIX family)
VGYVQELRALVGNRPLLLPGAEVLILDAVGRVLLQRRTDDGRWGVPGGAMEPGETVEDTARREVRAETGFEVGELTLVDLFSGTENFEVLPNGDQVYALTAVYTTTDVRGAERVETSEVRELRSFDLDDLPADLRRSSRAVLERYRARRAGAARTPPA